MNDPTPVPASIVGRLSWLTIAAGALVVALALGAMFWPEGEKFQQSPSLLVFDSSGEADRIPAVYEPLREYLVDLSGNSLDLTVVKTVMAYRQQLQKLPDFVLVTDGLAVLAPRADYRSLVVGRRGVPRNLRPRSVLVTRRGSIAVTDPWLLYPAMTIFGDSVSLVATGVLRRSGALALPPQVAAGPDPFDHGPVLHALRLGCFDYAIVREWDALRFREQGLLPPEQFTIDVLAGPTADLVLLISRDVGQTQRVACSDGLIALGRKTDNALARKLRWGLRLFHLTGFNLLIEQDFANLRKNYPGDWLPEDD